MTQEDKELLLKDLCARLPYKVKVCLYEKETCILMGIDGYEVYLNVDSDSFRIESIKPYLSPMSSMTEEECKEFGELPAIIENVGETLPNVPYYIEVARPEQIDWLNKNMFDYRGLIEQDLAIAVTKENNPYEN